MVTEMVHMLVFKVTFNIHVVVLEIKHLILHVCIYKQEYNILCMYLDKDIETNI